MAIEGPLRELGIHDVFQLLDLSRKTGVLSVTSTLRRNEGSVAFDGGAIVGAQIKTNPHQLGTLLVNSGKITPEDLKRALDRQKREKGLRLGQVLVEAGVLSAKELEDQVRFQVEEVVFEVMGWREGYFSFNEGPVPPDTTETPVRVPTGSVLMEGARRIDEWSRMESKIPHLGMVPALAPIDPGTEGELALEPPEWDVLASIDGERDVRGLAQTLARSEFEVARTIFGLASAGVILLLEPGARPSRRTPPTQGALERASAALAAGDLEGARAAAEAGAALHPREARAQWMLARVALASGRAAQGEEYLRRALRLDPLFAPAHRSLGDAMALQGKYAEAVDWWRRWLGGEDPDRSPADVDRVQEAIRAAQTLDALLRMPHG